MAPSLYHSVPDYTGDSLGLSRIAAESDADIIIFDPNATWTKGVDQHHMDVDYSCYEGMEVHGSVDTVLLRGQVIIDGDVYHGSKTDGQYLPRGGVVARL